MKWMPTLFVLCFVALVWGCSTSSESPSGETEVPTQAQESDGPNYEIAIKAPSTSKVGQEARTEIVVTPKNGYKVNLEYPAKLRLSTVPEGTKVSQQITKGQMNVEKTRLVVPVPFTAEAPGEKQFGGELRFSVCNPQSCQMPREQVTWTTVAEAAP